MKRVTDRQSGAVSIFIVVFTALLITVVTVSFVRVMVQDQQQASIVDLSRSAYDSAQAGVEDAKMALLRYQSACNSSGAGDLNCIKYKEWINSNDCNVAITNDAANTAEVKVRTGSSSDLNQAYTCVKVKLVTNDYLGMINQGESRLVPLIGTETFNKIKIEWFSNENLTLSGSSSVAFGNYRALQPGSSGNANATNVPAILRAQVIQLGSEFTLDELDYTMSDTGSSTFFLYPQSNGLPLLLANSDDRMNPTTTKPTAVRCDQTRNVAYSCSAEITLPNYVTNGDHSVFLKLSSIFGSSNDYRVTLVDTATARTVSFNAVQPEVDSTGRANDLFRRVRTRVDLSDINFPYASAAVESSGDFCKNFSITDNPSDYNQGSVGLVGGCTP